MMTRLQSTFRLTVEGIEILRIFVRRLLRAKGPLTAVCLIALLSMSGLAKPTLNEAGDDKPGRQEFKFAPFPLPAPEVESGSAEVKGKNGNISASTTEEAATVVFSLEDLEPGSVVRIVGAASLSEGEAQLFLEIDKKKLSRLRLLKPGQAVPVKFSATLPKGKARLVLELKPGTSASLRELQVEKLI